MARSVQTTLVSCASTLALCLASSWGDPLLMDPDDDYGPLQWKLYLFFIVFNLGMPWFFLSLRLLYVFRVRFVTGILKPSIGAENSNSNSKDGAKLTAELERRKILFRRLSAIGIMTVCPIAIPIPAEDTSCKAKVDDMVGEDRCRILSSSQLEKLCPLMMTPSKSSSIDGMQEDLCGYYGGCQTGDHGVRSLSEMESQSLRDSNRSCSSRTTPADAAAKKETNLEGRYLYFTGHENLKDEHGQLLDRLALVELRLVPPYDQLRFLRSRSRFQAVITVLHTLGFVMGVAQRMFVQGLGVSPAEVIVCFYAVISMVQVGLDLYTCSSFHTPLLLSLSPSQFTAFIHRQPQRRSCGNLSDYKNPRFSHITKIVGLLLLTVAAGPSIYYTYHYWEKASMVTRAVFPVFLLSYVLRPIVVALIDLKPLDSQLYFALASMLLTLAVAALAIVATVVEWEELFQAAARDTFAWVFPHVSAN